MKKLMRCICWLVAGAFVSLLASGPLPADEITDFYAGKQLTFALGFAAGGGGYDLYARTFARHYGRHVPGEPNVIVQNMPGGGGGMRAANYLYNAAPRDGSVIGMFAGSTAFEPLFDRSQAKFETPKFTWIGNLDESTGTCAVWHTVPVQRFDDLYTQELVFGASGAAGTSAQYPRMFKNLLGIKGRVVTGYTSTNEIILAMQRDEVQANCAMSLSVLKSQWADLWKSGQLRVIVQLGAAEASRDAGRAAYFRLRQDGRGPPSFGTGLWPAYARPPDRGAAGRARRSREGLTGGLHADHVRHRLPRRRAEGEPRSRAEFGRGGERAGRQVLFLFTRGHRQGERGLEIDWAVRTERLHLSLPISG